MRYKRKETCDEAWIEYCVDKTIEEIAEHFNVAVSTATTRCSKLGIKVKRKTKYPGIVEYAKEHTVLECANHYNTSYQNMYTYLRLHNIKHKQTLAAKGIERVATRRTGSAQEMIVTLCDHYSFASIASVFGYSKERVRQLYHKSKGEKV